MILLKRPYADVKGWTVEIHRPNKTVSRWIFGLRKAITNPIGLIKFLSWCYSSEIRHEKYLKSDEYKKVLKNEKPKQLEFDFEKGGTDE